MRRPEPRPLTRWWVVLGLVGFALAPWYALEDGLLSPGWWYDWPRHPDVAPALWHALAGDRPWLLPAGLALLAALLALKLAPGSRARSTALVAAGALGLAVAGGQGLAVGPTGWLLPGLEAALGPTAARQHGMGLGAALVHLGFLLVLTDGLAARGALRGDAFVTGLLGASLAFAALFVVHPLGVLLLRAVETEAGALDPGVLLGHLTSAEVWGLDAGAGRYGLAWTTLGLAVASGAGSTVLGLAFALLATRTRLPGRRALRALGVLPLITPPFVLGLALILLFGRAGAVTALLEGALGVAASRHIFGFRGVLVAQLLAFTPVAFLVLVGVLEGLSPTLEEAAATLRADPWRAFTTVTLPLLRPGLASAFLLGFIESLADFGNPMVLGGSFEVLATRIYFALAGAQSDVARAAALSLVLLGFTVVAFALQQRWVGDAVYTTVSGKGDGGVAPPVPRGVALAAQGLALPWALFTAAVYGVVLVGGFVRAVGHDHSPTLEHFRAMFAVSFEGPRGLELSGAAWDSLLTTLGVAAAAAPLTAAAGLATAYVLGRHRFRGRRVLELGTMLGFAVPGTVVGVGFVLAFNAPPVELTGTAAILVACFVARNMPVGVRAGLAALSQIDPSLDEASRTLGAGGAHTARRVLLPLLGPALVAALIYGFVRAMTAISAVVFLVSAEHNLATTYILGRVENGEYGPAIAYSALLIALMMLAVLAIERGVGARDLGRRAPR